MIRNLTLLRAKTGQLAEMIAIASEVGSLRYPGMRSVAVGPDLGLREGNWDFALVADFDDKAAYHIYDSATDHLEIRGRLAPLIEAVARIQFELPG